jgi:hypothetical protein
MGMGGGAERGGAPLLPRLCHLRDDDAFGLEDVAAMTATTVDVEEEKT